MLTREEALRKHREMWTAMQKELGDNPSPGARVRFKCEWCEERGEEIEYSCYLCQYDKEQFEDIWPGHCGDRCLVDWGTVYDGDYRCVGCCEGKTQYGRSPISEILALPEREVKNE